MCAGNSSQSEKFLESDVFTKEYHFVIESDYIDCLALFRSLVSQFCSRIPICDWKSNYVECNKSSFGLPKTGPKVAQYWFSGWPKAWSSPKKESPGPAQAQRSDLKLAQALGRPIGSPAQTGPGPQNFGPNPSLLWTVVDYFIEMMDFFVDDN